jgi:hypothetical protein
MILLILGILFLVIGFPASFYFARIFELPDASHPLISMTNPGLFYALAFVVMMLDILGVVFIAIVVLKKIL